MGQPSVTKNALNAQLKKGYPTINNKLVQIKKGYITKDGKWQQCFSGDIEFTYTGRYEIVGDLSGRWELVLLSSGYLEFKELNTEKIDIFLCGGGWTGGTGGFDAPSGYWSQQWGGNGGNGGRTKNYYGKSISLNRSYYCVVGDGAPQDSHDRDGQASSISDLSATTAGSPNYRQGGKHALAPPEDRAAGPGVDGYLAFDTSDTIYQPGHRYGASAGGAASASYNQDGSSGNGPGRRADTDGVTGGDWTPPDGILAGESAPENSGNGAGGYGFGEHGEVRGGKPGSGIIIIRPVL